MSKLTKEDIENFKKYFFVEVPIENLKSVVEKDENILHEARKWGWDDSVVRDELSTLLENLYGLPIGE